MLSGRRAEKVGKRVRAEKFAEHLLWVFENEVEAERRVEVVEEGGRPVAGVVPVSRARLVPRSRSSCQSLLSELVVDLSLLLCSSCVPSPVRGTESGRDLSEWVRPSNASPRRDVNRSDKALPLSGYTHTKTKMKTYRQTEPHKLRKSL